MTMLGKFASVTYINKAEEYTYEHVYIPWGDSNNTVTKILLLNGIPYADTPTDITDLTKVSFLSSYQENILNKE